LEPRLVAWNDTPLPLDDRCHGAIVTNWHLPSCQPILDELLRARIPTSVWSATDEPLPGKRYQDVRGMWFHNLAHGREAGRTMSEFVSSLPHRKVAWVSPFHGSVWSTNRLEGFKSSLTPGIEMVDAVHDWNSEWDIQVKVAWAKETLDRFDLEGLDPLNDLDALRRPFVEAMTRQRCLEIFGPALEQALASGATLWVAGSDLISRWCLHWLALRGMEVPRDLALVSFDDTRDASRLNLSSLRFDVQSMARGMIRQVLSSKQDHKLVTRYTGFVVERGSTGREERSIP
ncbi:MAG: substrate-binding domain-containing protein, partial [Fibrobacterota bacterium]